MQQVYFITARGEKQALFSDPQDFLDVRLESRLFGLGGGEVGGGVGGEFDTSHDFVLLNWLGGTRRVL